MTDIWIMFQSYKLYIKMTHDFKKKINMFLKVLFKYFLRVSQYCGHNLDIHYYLYIIYIFIYNCLIKLILSLSNISMNNCIFTYILLRIFSLLKERHIVIGNIDVGAFVSREYFSLRMKYVFL